MKNFSNTPLVSVVLATYNGEKFIEEQLKSLFAQTYKRIEIIIVDDCSTDNTTSIIKKYAAIHPPMKFWVNDSNLGYIKNFEKGLLLTSGDYIALCDQDDIWNERKIEKLVEEIGEYEIIYANSLLIDEEGKSLNKKLSDIKQLLDFDDCLCYTIGGSVPGHGLLMTRQLALKCIPFPANLPHDYWIGFVATCYGTMKYIDEVLVQYRQHDSNVIGIPEVAGQKQKKRKQKEKVEQIKERISLLYDNCPSNIPQKKVLQYIRDSYASFSLRNNLRRVVLFFQHQEKILAYKKKPVFKKWLFCLKMFVMIK